jgi:hypothetical protein
MASFNHLDKSMGYFGTDGSAGINQVQQENDQVQHPRSLSARQIDFSWFDFGVRSHVGVCFSSPY